MDQACFVVVFLKVFSTVVMCWGALSSTVPVGGWILGLQHNHKCQDFPSRVLHCSRSSV